MSATTANMMKQYGGPEEEETTEFLLTCDRFFDIMKAKSTFGAKVKKERSQAIHAIKRWQIDLAQ